MSQIINISIFSECRQSNAVLSIIKIVYYTVLLLHICIYREILNLIKCYVSHYILTYD